MAPYRLTHPMVLRRLRSNAIGTYSVVNQPYSKKKHLGFVLLDGFALMSTAAAMEPLRAANLFAGQEIYGIQALSLFESSAASSLGARFDTRGFAKETGPLDMVFVVAGGEPLSFRNPNLFAWLHKLDRQGVALGGISGGAAILAAAGLLQERRFTLHWHHLDAMQEIYPNLVAERRLYVIDRDRYTCAGGTAPLDMMYAIIAKDHGTDFARKISDWFIQTEIRSPDAPQQASVKSRYGALPAAVEAAIELMESHIADPLDADQIALLVGLSTRQLQRQFHNSMKLSMMQCYRNIRLDLAHRLILDTRLSMATIMDWCGYSSQPAFAAAYRKAYGRPPSQDRARSVARPA